MYNFGVFFKKVIATTIFFTLFAFSVCSAKPDISAESAILINASNGEVVAEYTIGAAKI